MIVVNESPRCAFPHAKLIVRILPQDREQAMLIDGAGALRSDRLGSSLQSKEDLIFRHRGQVDHQVRNSSHG